MEFETESIFIVIDLLALCVTSQYIDTKSIDIKSIPFRFHISILKK